MPDDIKLPEPVAYARWAEGVAPGVMLMKYDGAMIAQDKPSDFWNVPLYTADQVSAAVEADRAQRKPLTDEQIVACLVESSCVGTVKMSYDVGPYEITKLSVNAEQLTRAIEAAHGIPAPKGGSDA